MNTNTLKKFAQEARKKLVAQIGAKMDYVLNTDSVELREKEPQVNRLKEEIAKSSKIQVIDKVAYTWFNRLMALRFMDVNDFQPLGVRVISPKDGFTTPELLEEVKQGHIPTDLLVKKDRIFDLLDGKIPSPNSQNEVFKELLIGACNHLHKTLPFLFERINDYTDLLLPDDLISEFSIVQDIRNGMSAEDCKEVEIIGWLYQFYISEKKDQVFASRERVKKEDIPAATQLFTPRWIVEYMVQNTVGKLWLQNRPNSNLKEYMPYYIESASVQGSDYLKINSVEDIKLLDQACGSGHILVYGFDLIYKIYEEEGYGPQEIPKLILEKNLFGFEIDERAAQLASMALMMKARTYSRRLFRDSVTPHILCYEDLRLSKSEIDDTFRQIGVNASDALLHDLKNMGQATNLGSLIYPHSTLSELQTVSGKLQEKENTSDAFLSYQIQQLQAAVNQLIQLGEKYHCVVDNPPYMGGGNMNKELSDFVKINYPKSKADLMACFMEGGLKVLHSMGFLGMINQHSWMFLSSYEELRKDLVKNTFFDTLLHLGPRTFPEIGGEVVQNASFTFWKTQKDAEGTYIRLVDYDRSDLKRDKTLEAIQNPNCSWSFKRKQSNFGRIDSFTICYWPTEIFFSSFNKFQALEKFAFIDGKNVTANNDKFLRFHWEISKNKFESKYITIAKGGDFRKWEGNTLHLVDWSDEAKKEYRETNSGRLIKEYLWFKRGLTFSRMSKVVNCRNIDVRGTFDGTTVSFFSKNEKSINQLKWIQGFFNSTVGNYYVKILNPTLVFQFIDLKKIPVAIQNQVSFDKIDSCNEISLVDWDFKENSIDFKINNLIYQRSIDIEESFDLFVQFSVKKFFQLHRNEEELNRQFIKFYGLQEELTPGVPLEEITILQDELDREALKSQNIRLERDPETGLVTDYSDIELKFDTKEVFSQFISYAVGCMFGRYSLDKEGLILANQGETLEDSLRVIASEGTQSPTFLPDADNIIPILDDEWFEDDIVSRFKEFLRVTFGKENLEKNLAFVESAIGKDIRKYFVKDFYTDHIQRYKKRPIYWMFSSANGSFNVLIYMHRYTPDTLSKILNDYLNQYREKLRARVEHLDQVMISGTSTQQTKAAKEKDKIRAVLLELQEYERDILYPLATERISIDLDEGVLVNYNKFGKAIKEVAGLNDDKAKAKVRKFDWIDTSTIR